MSRFIARHYGSQKMSQRHNSTKLKQLLTLRDDLEALNPHSLSRSYGVPAPEIEEMIRQEKRRRLINALG